MYSSTNFPVCVSTQSHQVREIHCCLCAKLQELRTDIVKQEDRLDKHFPDQSEARLNQHQRGPELEKTLSTIEPGPGLLF